MLLSYVVAGSKVGDGEELTQKMDIRVCNPNNSRMRLPKLWNFIYQVQWSVSVEPTTQRRLTSNRTNMAQIAPGTIKNIAIIGAGPSGLATAK